MRLLAIWKSSKESVEAKTIDQLVGFAGDGALRDNSDCSNELRSFLSEVDSPLLREYMGHCLNSPFDGSGFVLQDLVNELGRRLDYEVTSGRYQGTKNDIGFDGLWKAPEGRSIIVEVKSTDAYRFKLDTIGKYRDRLIEEKTISANSILIVVGRQDTGELEAQVRGSKHAWDTRIISVEGLLKLVELKEKSDSPDTLQKIRSVLNPIEYTRLDTMIDIMFATVADVKGDDEPNENSTELLENENVTERTKGVWQFTDAKLLDAKRASAIAALSVREESALVKKSRALFWSPSKHIRAACAVSKRYKNKGAQYYWYAYHPRWDEFLAEGKQSYFVLSCMDRDEAFAIPFSIVKEHLPNLHTTNLEDGRYYWHIRLHDEGSSLSLSLPKQKRSLSLTEYAIKLVS